MKRLLLLIMFLCITAVGVGSFGATVRADSATPMSDAHLAQVRNNCVEAQSILNQLHASDALLRVDRGQLYESISTKLMAPLNSRIILNKLDGLNLVSITTDYDRQLATFRIDYQQYEESMSTLLAMDCRKKPDVFYSTLVTTRTLRQQTHDAAATLQKTIQKYGTEFDTFAKNFQAGNK